MIQPIRFLFDQSALGKPAVEHLSRLLELDKSDPKAEVRHIFDFENPDEWDEAWVPRMASGGWIVVAGDRGTRGGKTKGERLPRVCVVNNVSHVLLSRRIGTRKQFDKLLTIASVWHQLIAIPAYPKGSRFMLEPDGADPTHQGRGRLLHRIVEIPPPTGPMKQPEIILPD